MVINEINFPIYGTMIVVSLILGMIFNYYYLKKGNIKKQNILLFLLMILVFALIGGEMMSLLTEKNSNTIGLSSYGGAIGIIIASIIFEKICPSNNLYIKSSVISLPMIYAISKIGCFFSGCCYGLPCKSKILYVVYTEGLNMPLIPIQLIETVIFLLIFGICVKLHNNKNVIFITIILGAVSKFILDFFRYNHLEEVISKNQIVSIILIFISIVCIIKNEFYSKKNNNLKI